MTPLAENTRAPRARLNLWVQRGNGFVRFDGRAKVWWALNPVPHPALQSGWWRWALVFDGTMHPGSGRTETPEEAMALADSAIHALDA